MQVGDSVTWTSQASGFTKTKTGIVVAVVPAEVDPRKCVPHPPRGYETRPFRLKLKGTVIPRNHESYLVQVRKSMVLYWPRVSALTPTLSPQEAAQAPLPKEEMHWDEGPKSDGEGC